MFNSRHRDARLAAILAALIVGSTGTSTAQDGGRGGQGAQIAPANPVTAVEPLTCSSEQLASLDMMTMANGEFMLPVSLNGRTLPLVFDTGSIKSALTYEAASELKLKREPATRLSFLLNNIPILQEARIDDMKLGPIAPAGGWRVLLVPDAVLPSTVYGLIGPDFLQSNDFELDFLHGKMNVYRQSGCAGQVVSWTHDSPVAIPILPQTDTHIIVNALLDGKNVKVGLDTGSPNSVMSLDAARAMFGFDEQDPRLKKIGVVRINNGNPGSVYQFPFGALTFDALTMPNPQIVLIPQKNFAAGHTVDADIVLGMSALRQLHIYIDNKDHKVYLTDAEAR